MCVDVYCDRGSGIINFTVSSFGHRHSRRCITGPIIA